jgi:hypothetical protein
MINIEILKNYIHEVESKLSFKNIEYEVISHGRIIDPGSFEIIYHLQFYIRSTGTVYDINIYEEDVLDWIKEKRFEKINNIIND